MSYGKFIMPLKRATMYTDKIQKILCNRYPLELGNGLVGSYSNAIREYRKKNWQYAGNELGQFIEVARRIIELEITGKYCPLSQRLPLFNEALLQGYENAPNISISFRLLIPRFLFSMYAIRNKRGIVHVGEVEPNVIDLSVLIYCSKWILAEIVRLQSNFPFEETLELVNSIMDREESLFWNTGNHVRLLENNMDTALKVLCLLYYKDKQSVSELQAAIEYKNSSRFKLILKRLHAERKIEYTDNLCILSPLGLKLAEEKISSRGSELSN